MEFSTYDFIVLFIVVPILMFKFTFIPAWLFKKVKGINPIALNVVLAIVLTLISGIIVATCSQGVAIRAVAFMVALLACVIHYTYTSGKYNDDDSDGGSAKESKKESEEVIFEDKKV